MDHFRLSLIMHTVDLRQCLIKKGTAEINYNCSGGPPHISRASDVRWMVVSEHTAQTSNHRASLAMGMFMR